MADPTTLKDYMRSAIGGRLADGLSQAFGEDWPGRHIQADLALYLYAGDSAHKNSQHPGFVDQNSPGIRDAAFSEPRTEAFRSGPGQRDTVRSVSWQSSAMGLDLDTAMKTITDPDERAAFAERLKKALGGEHGERAAAAVSDYYDARAKGENAQNQGERGAAYSDMSRAMGTLMKEIKATVDETHQADGMNRSGVMGNRDERFAQAFGPTAQVNKDMHDYAASRAAQDNRPAIAALESATRGKAGYDHAQYMREADHDPAKLQTILDRVDPQDGSRPVTMPGDTDGSVRSAAEAIREAQKQGVPVTQQMTSAFSGAQIAALWGGQWNERVIHGDPDERATRAAIEGPPRESPSAAPASPAPQAPVPAAPAKPPAGDDDLLQGLVPDGVQRQSFTGPALRAQTLGLRITGGETVPAGEQPALPATPAIQRSTRPPAEARNA